MAIIDADAHVEEWAETFSDKYLPAEFAARRPQIATCAPAALNSYARLSIP